MKLRTKFFLALALITALVTTGVLWLVRQRVEARVREQASSELGASLRAIETTEARRQDLLESSAGLLSQLPPLMAVMSSGDQATIQDASATFWKLSRADLFVLAGRDAKVAALHTAKPGFLRGDAQTALTGAINERRDRDWWFGGGHLYQVFLQPITFGAGDEAVPMGVLAIGFELDAAAVAELSRAANAEALLFRGRTLVSATLDAKRRSGLSIALPISSAAPAELTLAGEDFLALSTALAPAAAEPVSLALLQSQAPTQSFLASLNRWILGAGLAAIALGGLLVYFVATTFTRPLGDLVAGVEALESGDFRFPLDASRRGGGEVATLTGAFVQMRERLAESQRQLIDNERLATIGRMAATISHDLRHPLTSITAYAEFLAERQLNETQRKDYLGEIRLAVGRMTDELNSLLDFSRHRDALRPVEGDANDVIFRAIETVRLWPEYASIRIFHEPGAPLTARFDAAKLERVLLNLLFNACEAAPGGQGEIRITSNPHAGGLEIRVADNGPGIPPAIRDHLFQPFVSQGKPQGIGLGLAVVQKIMQDHGGTVRLEDSPSGAEFVLWLPVGVRQPSAVAR